MCEKAWSLWGRLGIALFLMALPILLSGTARAEERAFTRFCIDVPETWLASEEEGIITLTDNNRTASITVRVLSPRDTLENTAAFFAEKTGGTSPVEEDGFYSFTYRTTGGNQTVSTRVMLGKSDDGSEFCMISVSGEHPEANAILRSLRSKD